MKRLSLLVPCALGLVACGSSDLGNPEHVRTWANAASALGVYAHVYEPIAFADGQHSFADPACPVTADDGTTVTIDGECTDSEGTDFFGKATITRATSGDLSLALDGYGQSSDIGDSRATGTFALHQISATNHEFEADLELEGGLTTTYSYVGSVEGTYGASTVWNGNGTVERRGMVAPTGVVEASTVDEVRDDTVCQGQSASGETTLRQGGVTTVITYDGATDCDDDEAAGWSVNGEDRGTIDGISCSTHPHRRGGAAPLSVLAALAGLGLLTRPRRRRT